MFNALLNRLADARRNTDALADIVAALESALARARLAHDTAKATEESAALDVAKYKA